ncbi:Hsp20/alpha crystallin family protein [Rothia halotolerans]|uniref:Hsp20/alpha crystallin family protein n=1 Tax=Rothia halotolerans TaxID=405770 RepID=UPI00101BD103|nr:Hsp20 family protein [Rothia halotolerans]
MLMRTDPFRDLERLSQQFFGTHGTTAHPTMMPMDAWREDGVFRVELDLPGVDPETIELDVERNVVTVEAHRSSPEQAKDLITAERPRGVFRRQLILGDGLDTSKIEAAYDAGVLGLKIPVAEQAKPRKIQIQTGSAGARDAIGA